MKLSCWPPSEKTPQKYFSQFDTKDFLTAIERRVFSMDAAQLSWYAVPQEIKRPQFKSRLRQTHVQEPGVSLDKIPFDYSLNSQHLKMESKLGCTGAALPSSDSCIIDHYQNLVSCSSEELKQLPTQIIVVLYHAQKGIKCTKQAPFKCHKGLNNLIFL